MSGRPIRALFIVPLLKAGGAERHLTTVLPRLDPARFTPSVVCIGAEGELFDELRAAGIAAKALYLRKRQAVRALRELMAIIRHESPDVVVVSGYNAETLGRLAARLAGVRHTIMWVHNASEITPRSVVHRTVDRALIRWTSGYFGVAQVQRRFLVDERRYPADKVRIIHNGVDPELFDVTTDREVLADCGIGVDGPVVGILGSLRPEKDHETFLRAARLVLDELPEAKFLIVGDGACRSALVTLCGELRIASSVHFAGARGDVGRMLRAMDVFAMTSTTECLPMALLEAMACGRPAVCTAVGGVVEVIEDGATGYLVPPKDPARLAARLIGLLSDPDTAHRMGREGRRRVETEFRLDHSVAAAQLAIEELVTAEYARTGGVNA
ncbi:glycosyltransferase [Mycolicibacterium fluoranthenivorans]|uniref:Glycosyltransferase involved in cell wall bisynthesis n=1 Tax=Mycolicibacterium fluoranthenivorans TaxID=258505 RepID=A0A1G4VJ87_9MYCO|nr:glycosyltransferase [Mycolicibacterium fluoranthenivorans]SCX07109.1 Glycosyltransferase involved in cell wall bisynthesis [Mycolicibacterium fluoranthenivorans]